MKQYKEYLSKTLTEGFACGQARDNMPETFVLPTKHLTFPFKDGFPILTGKKMPFYSILGELICFMQGKTDVRDYAKMGCNVWWDNAYKWNISDDIKHRITIEDYKLNTQQLIYSFYDLGRIYAAQWRDWTGGSEKHYRYGIDQLQNLIDSIINKPFSRYHVMTAWNPAELQDTCQPNCHVYYQATVVPTSFNSLSKFSLDKFLDNDTTCKFMKNKTISNVLIGHLTQRSCDEFLGVPYNITSYSLFTILLGILTNTLPLQLDWVGVNNHIYNNHVDQCAQYINSELYDLPKLHIEIDRANTLDKIMKINTLADLKEIFWLVDYKHGEKIVAPLSVGL